MQASTIKRASPATSCSKTYSSPLLRVNLIRKVPACASGREQGSTSAHHSAFAAVALSMLLQVAPANALGLESVDILPQLQQIQVSEEYKQKANKEAQKLQSVEDDFQKSDTLRRLLEQSEANREKNKKAVQDKYCYRQAELGVGDCGGLRYIPGMTENGKQRTPDWLAKILGVEPMPVEENALTLKDLFGEDFKKP